MWLSSPLWSVQAGHGDSGESIYIPKQSAVFVIVATQGPLWLHQMKVLTFLWLCVSTFSFISFSVLLQTEVARCAS